MCKKKLILPFVGLKVGVSVGNKVRAIVGTPVGVIIGLIVGAHQSTNQINFGICAIGIIYKKIVLKN